MVSALDGREALDRLRDALFDLVVLDLMLPKVDGFEVCRQMRARSSVPIIMLTAKAEEIDKVLGLELGADDYITKPFSVREFRSRVKAVLRRAELARGRRRRAGAARGRRAADRLRQARRGAAAASRSGSPTSSSRSWPRSRATPGRVFSRTSLLERVWGDSAYRDPRTVDVHIRHLREKLERDAKTPGADPDRARRGLPLPRPVSAPPCATSSRCCSSRSPRPSFGVIYFVVVPQLESNLEDQQLEDLRLIAAASAERLEEPDGAAAT